MLKKIRPIKKIKALAHTIIEKIKAHPYGNKLVRNWFRVAICLILLYMCGAIYTKWVQYEKSSEEREAVMRQIEEAKAEQKRLLEECEKLKQPAYIEQVAREELGFVKEGEIPYISREKKTH